MGREEQVEEREVLESIFPDEITDISDTEFRIAITLDLPDNVVAQAGDDDADAEPPVILLTVKYPESYPDKEPYLDLSSPQGSSSTHPLFNVVEDKETLLDGVQETIQENLGMAMIFTVVSAIKDAAEQLILDRQRQVDKIQEEAKQAAEREENEKFQGTTVTPESFTKWRDAFVKEMEEKLQREEEERLAELAKRGKGGGALKDGPKLTGRQLWERGLAGKVDDEDAIEADAEGPADKSNNNSVPVSDIQKLKIEA